MDIVVTPRKIIKFTNLVILSLIIINLSFILHKHLFGYFAGYRLLERLFNVDAEQNISAWYSSLMLFACAILLGIIAIAKHKEFDRYKWHWSALSVVFAWLSLDEAASLHEEAIMPLRTTFNLTGILYFSWTILGLIFVFIFSLVYSKFVFALPKQVRNLFFISAAIFISGAIGVEMLGGVFWEALGSETLQYEILAIIEEAFEMIGINIFLYSLISYSASCLNIRIYIKS